MASKTEKKSGQSKKKKRSKNASRKASNGQIKTRYSVDSIDEQWDQFVKGLGKASRQRFPQRVFTDSETLTKQQPALLWGFGSNELTDQTKEIVGQCQKVAAGGKLVKRSVFVEALEELTSTKGIENLSLDFSIQLLAVCAAFPKLAGDLPDELGQNLFRLFHDVASSNAMIDPSELPLESQLLFGELPILIAITFPDVETFPEFMDDGIQTIRTGVDELLDGNGLPHAKWLPQIQPLAACWIRSKAMCDSSGSRFFVGKQLSQFSHLIEQLFRLLRKDGSQVFSDPELAEQSPGLIAAALQVDDDATNPRIAATVIKGFAKSQKKKRNPLLLPEPSDHSEWSEVATMQSDWSRGYPKLVATWADRKVLIELNCNSTVFSGEWQLEVELDGKPLKSETDWSVACWFSDDDCDFLELEMDFEHGVLVQRQIMLGREDHLLYMADAIIGNSDGEISYRSTLPMHASKSWDQASESNEGHIVNKNGKRIAALMPLALPEWQSEKSGNKFSVADNELVYSSNQQYAGYYPLFIDLDTQRIRQPLTWRRLTVAQQLRIVDPHEAAGFRVQSGDSQWMFYRSLTKPENRTLLGQNLVCEFFAGDFDLDGETNELVSIE